MIKFEHNMLVLNNTFSNEDVEEINAFAEYVRNQERERIIALLEETDLLKTIEGGSLTNYAETAIALINGENE